MSGRDNHLAYGHYNPASDRARGGGGGGEGGGGGGNSDRGFVGDTFNMLKDTYKSNGQYGGGGRGGGQARKQSLP